MWHCSPLDQLQITEVFATSSWGLTPHELVAVRLGGKEVVDEIQFASFQQKSGTTYFQFDLFKQQMSPVQSEKLITEQSVLCINFLIHQTSNIQFTNLFRAENGKTDKCHRVHDAHNILSLTVFPILQFSASEISHPNGNFEYKFLLPTEISFQF